MYVPIGIIVVLTGLVVLTGAGHAEAPEPGRCRELKAAATAQRVSDLLDAYARNRARSDPPRLKAEIAEADAAFDASFAEAEAEGNCARTNNAQTLRKKSDEFVRKITIETLQPGAARTGATTGDSKATGKQPEETRDE